MYSVKKTKLQNPKKTGKARLKRGLDEVPFRDVKRTQNITQPDLGKGKKAMF